ncbi:MAG: polysaccharide biosynthesis tyrosine autokinase [Bacteroidales bacterium]|nr:polysaccharide biosynthesis tyrosine autokinase [Bacteroidales bacterium]
MNNYTDSRQNFTDDSDIKRYLKLFYSKWYYFPVSLLLALLIVKAVNEVTTPIYRAKCNIVIGDDLADPITNSQILGSGIDFSRINPINKEIGVLKSKKLAEETIDSLNLTYQCYELKKGYKYFKRRVYNNIPFEIIIDSADFFVTDKEIILKITGANTIEVAINSGYNVNKTIKTGEKFTCRNFSFTIRHSKGFNDFSGFINKKYSYTFKSVYALASEYTNKLKVEIDPVSQNILKLSIEDENLFQSIDYLNMLCDLYIKNDINIRNIIATKTIEYIDLQLGILSEQLNEAEDSLIDFNRNNKMVLSELGNQLAQNYYQLEKEIEELNLRSNWYREMTKMAGTLKNSRGIIFSGGISTSDEISKQLELINSLVVQREVLLKNQSESSLDVKLIDQQIDVNIKILSDYYEKGLEQIENTKKYLAGQLSFIDSQLQSLPESQRKRIKFEREFKLAENIYNIYQQKRIEAILAKESTISKIRILDPARYEDHMMVSPREKYNYRVGVTLALLLPALLIIVYKSFSNKIEDFNEIRAKSKSIILGKIYHAELVSELPIVDFPQSAIAESFYKLFTRLKFLKPEPGVKIISVTSGASGDGKTFCASNLASAIALTGKRVALLSLDLRRPKIHDIFDVQISPGIVDYLLNRADLKNIIRNTKLENLDIVPSGSVPPDPIALINQPRMGEMFKLLSDQYDYVIVDTPPIGMVADSMLIGKLSDLTIMILRIRFTKKVIFELIDELQENNNLENLALVVNDIKAFNSYSGNGYYKYYHVTEKKEKKSNLI